MQTITLPKDTTARAAFLMDGDYMAPYLRPGEVVTVEWALPGIGECALFETEGKILLRQYCEDSFGNIYLFVLNRSRRDMDVIVPPGQPIRCLGLVPTEKKPPLPLD